MEKKNIIGYDGALLGDISKMCEFMYREGVEKASKSLDFSAVEEMIDRKHLGEFVLVGHTRKIHKNVYMDWIIMTANLQNLPNLAGYLRFGKKNTSMKPYILYIFDDYYRKGIADSMSASSEQVKWVTGRRSLTEHVTTRTARVMSDISFIDQIKCRVNDLIDEYPNSEWYVLSEWMSVTLSTMWQKFRAAVRKSKAKRKKQIRMSKNINENFLVIKTDDEREKYISYSARLNKSEI